MASWRAIACEEVIKHLVSASFISILVAACDGSAPADAGQDSGALEEDAASANTDAGPPDGGPPDAGSLPAPGAVAFADRDIRRAFASGQITVARTADESRVESYEIVWLDSSGAALGAPIASIARTVEPLTHTLDAAAVPDGAIEIAAIAVGPSGRSEAGLGAPADNYPRRTDIGGELGRDHLAASAIARDRISDAIFIAAVDGGGWLTIRRCNDVASECEERERIPDLFRSVGAAVSGSHLYVVASRSTRLSGEYPGHLYVCPIDAGDLGPCELHTLDGSPTGEIAFNASAAYVALDGYDARPRVAQCPLPPTLEAPCTTHDVRADAPEFSGYGPAIAVDDEALYVAASNYDGGSASLFACPLDDGGAPVDCAYTSHDIGWPTQMIRYGSHLVIGVDLGLSRCTADAGRVTSCERVDADLTQSYAMFMHGMTLYASVQREDRSDALLYCALEGPSLGPCDYLPVPDRGPFVMGDIPGEAFIAPRGNARILRCASIGGEPYTCTTNDVSTDPLGFHGTPIGMDTRGDRLIAVMRAESFYLQTITSCAIDAAGAIASCEQSEWPNTDSIELAPHLSASHVHFGGTDVENHPFIRTCAIGEGASLESCTDHTIGEHETGAARLHIAGDRIFAAATAHGSNAIVAIGCTLDAGGAPTDCAHAEITVPPADFSVRGNARAVYVARHEYPSIAVYACPRGATGFDSCERTSVGDSMRGGYDFAVSDTHLYASGLALTNAAPLLYDCALAENGAIGACSTVDLSALGLMLGASAHLAVFDERIYLASVRALDAQPILVACDVGADGAPFDCAAHDLGDEGSAHEERYAFTIEPANGTMHLLSPDPRQRLRPTVLSFRAF